MLTLNQMVRNECANFKQGRCLFGECSVLNDKPCRISAGRVIPTTAAGNYFAVAVAPLHRQRPEYTDAAIQYARLCGPKKQTVKIAAARECECGELLKPRQRMCDGCRRKKATEAQRAWRAGHHVES